MCPFMVLEAKKFEIKVSAGLVPCGGSIPCLPLGFLWLPTILSPLVCRHMSPLSASTFTWRLPACLHLWPGIPLTRASGTGSGPTLLQWDCISTGLCLHARSNYRLWVDVNSGGILFNPVQPPSIYNGKPSVPRGFAHFSSSSPCTFLASAACSWVVYARHHSAASSVQSTFTWGARATALGSRTL